MSIIPFTHSFSTSPPPPLPDYTTTQNHELFHPSNPTCPPHLWDPTPGFYPTTPNDPQFHLDAGRKLPPPPPPPSPMSISLNVNATPDHTTHLYFPIGETHDNRKGTRYTEDLSTLEVSTSQRSHAPMNQTLGTSTLPRQSTISAGHHIHNGFYSKVLSPRQNIDPSLETMSHRSDLPHISSNVNQTFTVCENALLAPPNAHEENKHLDNILLSAAAHRTDPDTGHYSPIERIQETRPPHPLAPDSGNDNPLTSERLRLPVDSISTHLCGTGTTPIPCHSDNDGVPHFAAPPDSDLDWVFDCISISQLACCLEFWINKDLFIEDNKDSLSKLQNLANSLIQSTTLPHQQSVINFSSKPLTDTQLRILQKGLSFCPTPGEPRMGDLVRDMEYFHDNLRWDYHFRDTPSTTTPFERLVMLSKTLKKRSRPPAPPPRA